MVIVMREIEMASDPNKRYERERLAWIFFSGYSFVYL